MTGVARDARIALLREYGSFPQAYSATYQPGLSHFGDKHGFIAYKKIWGTAFALAEPVAPPDRHAELIARFLRAHPDAAFCQISRPFAELLVSQGFRINEMGPDARLDLASYDFSGRDKQNLRTAINRAAKEGYRVRECALTSLDVADVRMLSDDWRESRIGRNHEISFLNRPFVLADEPDVRQFFLFDRDDRLMALGGFDPIYRAGAVIGYIAQHNRHRPGADVGAFADYAIKHHAIQVFQQEGRECLHLGLAPFAYIEDRDFLPHKDWLVRRAFAFCFRNHLVNRFAMPFRGHELHKRQFRGMAEQTYFAFNTPPALPRLFKLMRACDII